MRELHSCMKFAHLQRLLDLPLPSLLSLICALHITSFSVVCRMSQTDKYTKRTAPYEITQNEQKNAAAALRAEVHSTVSVWFACTATSEILNFSNFGIKKVVLALRLAEHGCAFRII